MNDSENPAAETQTSIEILKEIQIPTSVFDLDLIPAAAATDSDSASGERLLAACLSGEILEIDPETEAIEILAQHQSYASGAHWHRELKTAISAGYDGCLLWTDRARKHTYRNLKTHQFWSWQSALSPDQSQIASVTGQYLSGSYEYKPAASNEPCVRIVDVESGVIQRSWEAQPPVQAVTWSPDGKLLAVGNLMGQVRIWNTQDNELVAEWETGEFTGWGIIKGHYYTGGIYALKFAPDGESIYLVGMGSTRDPAAGNGRQMWQRRNWQTGEKISETSDKDSGQGLMEWMEFHPSGKWFVMTGRLQSGKWNVALFDSETGAMLHSLNTKNRVTRAVFSQDGQMLFLGGMVSQGGLQDGKFKDYGRVAICQVL